MVRVCSYCEDVIEECDWCGKRFRKGNKIICLDGGVNHFCSKKCLDEFLKVEARPAEVILEDER